LFVLELLQARLVVHFIEVLLRLLSGHLYLLLLPLHLFVHLLLFLLLLVLQLLQVLLLSLLDLLSCLLLESVLLLLVHLILLVYHLVLTHYHYPLGLLYFGSQGSLLRERPSLASITFIPHIPYLCLLLVYPLYLQTLFILGMG
jgi:hypothetical protein